MLGFLDKFYLVVPKCFLFSLICPLYKPRPPSSPPTTMMKLYKRRALTWDFTAGNVLHFKSSDNNLKFSQTPSSTEPLPAFKFDESYNNERTYFAILHVLIFCCCCCSNLFFIEVCHLNDLFLLR